MTFCIIKNRATCYTTCFPIPANAQIHVFAASGGVCEAYAVAPLSCYRNGIHKIRMYPGRGVLHTLPERFRRKRRGVPMHKNDHSPPPAVFVRRMLLRPYHITRMESIKYRCTQVGAYCIRPPERFRRKRRGLLMHKNDHSPPPAVFVGRMQYAPTMLQEWNP